MSNEPVAYINVEERKLEWAAPPIWNTTIIAKVDKVPLYTRPTIGLSEFEIREIMALDECWIGEDCSTPDLIAFAEACIQRVLEK